MTYKLYYSRSLSRPSRLLLLPPPLQVEVGAKAETVSFPIHHQFVTLVDSKLLTHWGRCPERARCHLNRHLTAHCAVRWRFRWQRTCIMGESGTQFCGVPSAYLSTNNKLSETQPAWAVFRAICYQPEGPARSES